MAVSSVNEDALFDPDELKMPESPLHREAIDAIAFAAMTVLGDTAEIYRDMNWYPVDGGNAVAPDVMVLPPGTLALSTLARPKSYRQDQTGGPAASVVVEVPSDTDSWGAMMVKVRRYQRLGTTVYVVIVDESYEVYRYGPTDRDSTSWENRPMPELGGIAVTFEDETATVILPNGLRGSSHAELAQAQLGTATSQLDKTTSQLDEATSQIEALAEQLRANGIEPSL